MLRPALPAPEGPAVPSGASELPPQKVIPLGPEGQRGIFRLKAVKQLHRNNVSVLRWPEATRRAPEMQSGATGPLRRRMSTSEVLMASIALPVIVTHPGVWLRQAEKSPLVIIVKLL